MKVPDKFVGALPCLPPPPPCGSCERAPGTGAQRSKN